MDALKNKSNNNISKYKQQFHQGILQLLSNTYVLSFIFSIIIILFLPTIFSKYIIKEVSHEKRTNNDSYAYYVDLDNDGFSEKIRIDHSAKGVGIIVSKNRGTINQWNFKGSLLSIPPFYGSTFFGDIDNDGISEIFQLTLSRDTIYLSCFNPLTDSVYIMERAITNYYKTNGNIDCAAEKCTLYDMNNDSFNEVYFTINASFSLYPRRMFCYDAVNDTLYSSPLGASTFITPTFFDIDNDGKSEFWGNSSGVGNSSPTSSYSDYFTWLMILDEKMNFKFEPIKVSIFPSAASVIPFQTNSNTYLAFFNNYTGIKNIRSSLMLFDKSGNKIREKMFDKSINLDNARLFSINNDCRRLFLIRASGEIQEYNSNLKIISEFNLPPIITLPTMFDLDKDGEKEIIFTGKYNDKLIITRNDFSNQTFIDIPELNGNYYFSLVKNGSNGNELFLCGNKHLYIYSYSENIFFYLRFLFYIGIYFGSFSFILIIQKTQKHRIEEKYKAERKIAELQMLSIKNQVDPHFTLNIINSIGSLFYKRDMEKANFIFGKYSKLLRNTILGSDQIVTTLENEIDYVGNYLELEKFRLADKFNFSINIDKTIDPDFNIPKTLIHTFVENAVKHGIKPSDKKGLITIDISDGDVCQIYVRDNGVGREKAKRMHTFGTGKGLDILNQILDLYFILMKKRIVFKITDITDESKNSSGTEVCIKIPVK